MYYLIRVSKENEQIFATDDRSIRSTDKLIEVFPSLSEKFPESEGYEITVSYVPEICYTTTREKLLPLIASGSISQVLSEFETVPEEEL